MSPVYNPLAKQVINPQHASIGNDACDSHSEKTSVQQEHIVTVVEGQKDSFCSTRGSILLSE